MYIWKHQDLHSHPRTGPESSGVWEMNLFGPVKTLGRGSCAGEEIDEGKHQEAELTMEPLSWVLSSAPSDHTPCAASLASRQEVLNEFQHRQDEETH